MTSVEGEGPRSLVLLGYEVLMPQGFALPCFATTSHPNVWYVAVSQIEGDRQSPIVAFEPYLSATVVELPPEQHRICRLGDPWCDVFLFQGEVLVGTPLDLGLRLRERSRALEAEIPLTLFELAQEAPALMSPRVSVAAIRYVQRRFGAERADRWRIERFRSDAILRLRRRFRTLPSLAPDMRRIEVVSKRGSVQLLLPVAIFEALGTSSDSQRIRWDIELFAHELDLAWGGFASLDEPEPVSPSTRPEDETAPASLLMVTLGRRAAWCGELARPCDWWPQWDGIAEPERRLKLRVCAGESGGLDLTDVSVVVLLVDDDIPADVVQRLLANELSDPRATVLLAPALSREQSSPRLISSDPLPPGVHALVDTSLVRSPLARVSDPRRSFERSVADIAVAAATLVASHTDVQLEMRNVVYGAPPRTLTFGFVAQRPDPTEDELSTESSYRQRSDGFVRRWTFAAKVRWLSHAQRGVVELRDPSTDFARFAELVLRRRFGEHSTHALPDPGVESPSARQSAAFDVGFGRGGYLTLLDRAPTLAELVRIDGAGVVGRYTDGLLLDQIYHGDEEPLPSEIAMPAMAPEAGATGAVTRGPSPADVLLIPRALFADWRGAMVDDPLVGSARRYRRYIDPERARFTRSTQMAISKVAFQEALRDGRRAAHYLYQLLEPQSQLNVKPQGSGAPLPPVVGGVWRFALSDAPPFTFDLLRPGELGGDPLLLVDGDAGLPALLNSTVFRVWAQATASHGPRPRSRYVLSQLLGAFPLPAGCQWRPGPQRRPYLDTREAMAFSSLAQPWQMWLQAQDGGDESSYQVWMTEHGIDLEREDEHVLDAFDIPYFASRIEILVFLADENSRRAQAKREGAPAAGPPPKRKWRRYPTPGRMPRSAC